MRYFKCPICQERGFEGRRGLNIHIGKRHHKVYVWMKSLENEHKKDIQKFYRKAKRRFKDATRSELIDFTVVSLMTYLGISGKYKSLIYIVVATIVP